ncbi:MAG: polysaccharide pyruvyl transferase family protein [Mesorhizobium sp.]|nr:MAG: polysaccharide pyruvyl transferase family protein [Mesorhizobium sp.]
MTPVLRVGIFGFYSYQNLGDNVMAYLFSKCVKDDGHDPIVYAKRRSDKMDWGFKICSDIKEFVESVDVVIFGGGGLLIPRQQPSEVVEDFNDDLELILEYTIEKSIKLFAFSIGGAGKDIDEIVPVARQELIRRLTYVTLRNREDLKLLAQANTEGEFLDDVVWTTSRKISGSRYDKGRSRLRVGLNIYLGSSRRSRLAKRILQIVTRIRKDIDFIFYEINPKKDGHFGAFCANLTQDNCSSKILTDVEDACGEASSLDLLITTRLHFGVIAMSYGVPCIAYSGAEKTKLLYKHINRSSFFWRIGDIHKLLFLFLFPGAIQKIVRDGSEVINPVIVENAMQHYTRLSRSLEGVLGASSRSVHHLQ